MPDRPFQAGDTVYRTKVDSRRDPSRHVSDVPADTKGIVSSIEGTPTDSKYLVRVTFKYNRPGSQLPTLGVISFGRLESWENNEWCIECITHEPPRTLTPLDHLIKELSLS